MLSIYLSRSRWQGSSLISSNRWTWTRIEARWFVVQNWATLLSCRSSIVPCSSLKSLRPFNPTLTWAKSTKRASSGSRGCQATSKAPQKATCASERLNQVVSACLCYKRISLSRCAWFTTIEQRMCCLLAAAMVNSVSGRSPMSGARNTSMIKNSMLSSSGEGRQAPRWARASSNAALANQK